MGEQLGVGRVGFWGVGFSSVDIARKRGLACAHSHQYPAGRRHGEADKEERHTARGQHAPGGWGILPPRRVGGAAGGRSIRVGRSEGFAGGALSHGRTLNSTHRHF